MIQGSTALGLFAGALAAPAVKPEDAASDFGDRYGAPGVLARVNVGLATVLALAYLPDQRAYGPTWQRVVLVDRAAAAGAFSGAVRTAVNKFIGAPSEGCTLD